jgi:hypothetical protein
LAAREANIIHFLPSTIATGTLVSQPLDRLPATLDKRIAWVRENAGARFDEIELGPSTEIVIANDRRAATERLIHENGWDGIGVEQVWEMPGIFVGSVDEIVAEMVTRRERFGFSYFIVASDKMETCAPIVARLAGMP